jgi:threonine aldolase
MRQAGVIAAAGLIALEEGPKRLPEDHENAQILARGLAQIPGVQLDLNKVQTNIIIFDLSETLMQAPAFVERLRQRKVLAGAVDATRIRLVTHRDVSRSDIQAALRIIAEAAGAAY